MPTGNTFDPRQLVDISIQTTIKYNSAVAKSNIVNNLLGRTDIMVDGVFPMHVRESLL
ncbi:hypothetical protein ACFL47_02740 [Candidatus Latescibacterota bacterium]